MATVMSMSLEKQIGETAGTIWHMLEGEGALSLAQIVKRTEAPRDVVMAAIGWLAREEKLHIEEVGRGRQVSLK